MKKFLSLLLVITMLLSSNMCILADDNTITVTSDSTQEVPVTADIASTFTVTIPKTITITDNTKPAEFIVSADGDIGGGESLFVYTDEEVVMSSNGKDNVTLGIAQMFNASNSYLPVSYTGKIFTDGLTAGEWNGVLNFYIQREDSMNVMFLSLEAYYISDDSEWTEHSSVKHIIFDTNFYDDMCQLQQQIIIESNSYEEYNDTLDKSIPIELMFVSNLSDWPIGHFYGTFNEETSTLYIYTICDATVILVTLDPEFPFLQDALYCCSKEKWMEDIKACGVLPNLDSVEIQ